jgi:hypothetical protein
MLNWFGYRLINSILEEGAVSRLEMQLDSEAYDQSILVTLKIPINHLFYYSNSVNFERINGRIDLNGITFSYVKMRLLKDSVELVCIPDYASMKFKQKNNDFFRLCIDLPFNGKKSGTPTGLLKFFNSECYPIQELKGNTYSHFIAGKLHAHYLLVETTYFPSAIENPPEKS